MKTKASELSANVRELGGSWRLTAEQTPEGLLRYGREVSLLTELEALTMRLAQTGDTSDLAKIGDLVAAVRDGLAKRDAAVRLANAVMALRVLTKSVPVDPSNFVRMKHLGRGGRVIAALA